MLCKNPFIRDPFGKVFHTTNKDDWYKGIPFPCGQCLPCRINKRRVWSTRLWLETMSHADNLPMLTLTYHPDDLPLTWDNRMTLCKKDIQHYIKGLRNKGYKFRYYCVGEYGEHTHRPHYHLLVFGVSPLCLPDFVADWHHGLVDVGYDTSFEAIQYTAGYVTKKFVKKDSTEVVPEFALMSRKPAIGSFALHVILNVFKEHPEIVESALRNFSLKVNGHYSPIGRTLTDKLRALSGCDSTNDFFLYEMRKLALDTSRNYDPVDDHDFNGPLVQYLLEESKQRIKQITARHKIFASRTKV